MMTRLVNWFRRRKLESGLDRELEYHLDRRITELQGRGLSGSGSPEASQAGDGRAPHRSGRMCGTSG